MRVDRIKVPIEYWQIEEILDRRIGKQKVNISDLFVVYPSSICTPDPGHYDTFIETKYGKLRFFFSPEMPKEKVYVLHKEKFDYPRKNVTKLFDTNGDLIQ